MGQKAVEALDRRRWPIADRGQFEWNDNGPSFGRTWSDMHGLGTEYGVPFLKPRGFTTASSVAPARYQRYL